MKRLIYIISALLFVACTGNLSNLEEPDVMRSQMVPAVCLDPVGLPPGATKALVDASTAVSMEANVLRIDEGAGERWSQAYLAEADVASASTGGLRSMYLNPVQAYNGENVTRLVSWYPRTCSLHKDEEGNAVTIKLEDFQINRQEQVYTEKGGSFSLNFSGLDGSKDIMVSNVVEGTKSEPFGSQKPMNYTHYMSAVKVYAYVENSSQDVSMWGALRKVVVKNQPSKVSVTLPAGSSEATFSDNADFPLIKTAMFGDADQNPEIAPDAPVLDTSNDYENRIYLGYALIKPKGEDDETLKLDIHTDAGMISVDVPMSSGEGNSKVNYFQAGFIYTVNICFNTQNAIAAVVLRSGEEHYYDLSSGQELDGGIHAHRNANCYIVHPGIKRIVDDQVKSYDGYSFDATVVGNGEQGLYKNSSFDRTTTEIDPVRAGLLWESSQGLVTQVELLYGYVRFKAADPAEKEGNAVIAVYDSQRRVIWSWHIWITDEPKDVTYTVNGQDIVLLDRNLGATAAVSGDGLATYGLYYQWGRKDPSMGPKVTPYLPQSTETATYYDYYGDPWNYTGVVTLARPTVRDGVENPMYLMMPSDFSMTTYQYDWLYTNIDNLWGDYDHSTDVNSRRQKTIYDPCPFGYMVPQDEISTLFASTATDGTADDGFKISGRIVDDKGTSDKSDDVVLNGSYQSFFPFAGYKGVDKGVSSLTGAWKYVGEKGDYMSSKIEPNGHRSRTYISNAPSWTEYGADNDNDGDGDASRTYSSRIYADDMANRRTAASIRCVKRGYALNSSIIANLTSDKKLVFVGDPRVTFSYSIEAFGGDATITSAQIDVNEEQAESLDIPQEQRVISGEFTRDVPETAGLYRYRLISTSSTDVTSRVSYALRVFDLQGIKINDGFFYENDATLDYGTKYAVSFTLKGVETDFSVYVNGVKATKGTVTTDDGVASMPFSVGYTAQGNLNPENGVYIPGHLHIQILDASGSLAYEKTYHVKMNGLGSSTLTLGDEVTDASQLEAGALYVIRTYAKYNNNYHNKKLEVEGLADNNPAVDINNVFLYHRDDTKIVSTSYSHVSAGALFNMSADAATSQQLDDGFVKSNFSFGLESEALYATIANNYTNNNNRFTAIYWGDNIRYLSISNQRTLETTTRARGDTTSG